MTRDVHVELPERLTISYDVVCFVSYRTISIFVSTHDSIFVPMHFAGEREGHRRDPTEGSA